MEGKLWNVEVLIQSFLVDLKSQFCSLISGNHNIKEFDFVLKLGELKFQISMKLIIGGRELSKVKVCGGDSKDVIDVSSVKQEFWIRDKRSLHCTEPQVGEFHRTVRTGWNSRDLTINEPIERAVIDSDHVLEELEELRGTIGKLRVLSQFISPVDLKNLPFKS